MIYLTGDTNGDFSRIQDFCSAMGTTKDDIMIVLGGASMNYNGGQYDYYKKKNVSALPIKFFFIHGCHEIRPETLENYKEIEWNGGTAYIEEEFPDYIFAKDGEVYNLNGHKTLVCGGGYSPNKEFCIRQGVGWYPDEQPDAAIKARVEAACEANNWIVDVVLTHSAPAKFAPAIPLPPMVSEASLDKSTELWLDEIENKLHYNFWFCGHYQMDLAMDPFYIMYETYEAFPA
ncbi:MAG: serine/threonine protein phosphatase [Firmicutes bacterium]|nr:serine/threonine protein phosphatase [Bacillota bacterium]